MPSARAAAVLLGLLLSACGGGRQSPVSAVPDASVRLLRDIPAEDPGRAAAFEAGLEDAVCLLRTGTAEACTPDAEDRVLCNTRSEAAIRETLRPLFDVLPALRFESPFSAPTELREALPEEARVTMQVLDARRQRPCWDWSDGACAAVRFDDLWVLLRKTSLDRPGVHRIELFPAGRVCAGEPGG